MDAVEIIERQKKMREEGRKLALELRRTAENMSIADKVR